MDIFVDTGILYNDPYWRHAFNGLLLDRAREGAIRLYLSELVHKTIFQGHVRHVDELFRTIGDAADVLYNQYSMRAGDIKARPRRSFLDEFHTFYDGLVSSQVIVIIPAGTETLPNVEPQATAGPGVVRQERDIVSPSVLRAYEAYVNQHILADAYLLTTQLGALGVMAGKAPTRDMTTEGMPAGFQGSHMFSSSRQMVKSVIAKQEVSKLDASHEQFFRGMDGNRVTEILKRYFSVQVEAALERRMKCTGVPNSSTVPGATTDHFFAKIANWQDTFVIDEHIAFSDRYIMTGQQLFAGTLEGLQVGNIAGSGKFYPYGPVNTTVRASITITFNVAGAPIHCEVSEVHLEENGPTSP